MLEHTQALRREGHQVAMLVNAGSVVWPASNRSNSKIGDEFNDGPSLAAADVGTMFSHGTQMYISWRERTHLG